MGAAGMTGICDCHVHVVGAPDHTGLVAARTYTPPPAPLDALRRLGAPHGVTRFVIVQPSFYGTDNSLLLDALDALGGHGRGVAVLDPARADAAALADMARRGVRGLRLNLYSSLSRRTRGHGAATAIPEATAGAARALADAFGATAALARAQGWHVQVIAPMAALAEAADLLAASPVPVVVDHYALHGGEAPDGTAGRAALALLSLPHVWCKLSAPYRSSLDSLALQPDPAWLRAILDASPRRCVWGSDWPHTPPHEQQTGAGVSLPYRALDYGAVLRGLADALPPAVAPDEVLRRAPARLYGFPPA